MKEPSNYLKHSNQTRLSLLSIFTVTELVLRFILTSETDCFKKIGEDGAIKLSEALKSNSSLKVLDLSCNRLVASFHSHSIQIIILVLQQLSKYLKRSNQIHLSLPSISAVTNLLLHFISLNIGNLIESEGAIKLSEALKLNSTLTSLNLSCNKLVSSFHSHSIQIMSLVMQERSN
jgi:hypothetical protein